MIVVGVIMIGVDGPRWVALVTLYAGAIIAGIAIVSLVLRRRT